jgi:hypothetical protein
MARGIGSWSTAPLVASSELAPNTFWQGTPTPVTYRLFAHAADGPQWPSPWAGPAHSTKGRARRILAPCSTPSDSS